MTQADGSESVNLLQTKRDELKRLKQEKQNLERLYAVNKQRIHLLEQEVMNMEFEAKKAKERGQR